MNYHHKITTVLAALVMSTALNAQEVNDGTFSIEIDPATYAFNGYALHLKKSFKALPKWEFGLGTYSMDFPDALVNMSPENRDKGWGQRLDKGFGFFVDYFFKENQEGLFTGIQLAHQEYDIERNGASSEYTTFLAMGYVGYQYEFYNSFYVKPWIGLGHNTQVSGSNKVNGMVFEVPSIIVFPTVHVGYKF
jgi:hypothetical protein